MNKMVSLYCSLGLSLCCWAAVLLGSPVMAASGIIYSARYYYQPSVHATSHYHIYRIDPDGRHRVQLTFGSLDDQDPKWSPDGRWIAFNRGHANELAGSLTLISCQGTQLRSFAPGTGSWSWMPDSRTIEVSNSDDTHVRNTVYSVDGQIVKTWTEPSGNFGGYDDVSPDGRFAYRRRYQDNIGTLVDAHTGKVIVHTQGDLTARSWQGNGTLAGIYSPDDNNKKIGTLKAGQFIFTVLGMDGSARQTTIITEPTYLATHTKTEQHILDQTLSGFWPSGYYGIAFDCLESIPSRKGAYLAWQSWLMHGNEGLFYIVPSRGIFRFLGNFIANTCSQKGEYVVGAPYRDTSQYVSDRVVWTAPLQIVNMDTGIVKRIVSGLVDVDSTDWR
jgi:hypothetical protein